MTRPREDLTMRLFMLIKSMSLPPLLFAPFWIGLFLDWMSIVCQRMGNALSVARPALWKFI